MKSVNRTGGTKKVLGFISEAGMLKRVQRSGWTVLGIKNPESVADHSFRCAVIGYLLAREEKASAHKVLLMTLFNDMQEARITDLHKMAQRYIECGQAEERVFKEQVKSLPAGIRKELTEMRVEYKNQRTKESLIARDADILECLIQAKEYYEYGYKQAAKFMKKAPGFLVTKSARKLWRQAKNIDTNDWWISIGDFKR